MFLSCNRGLSTLELVKVGFFSRELASGWILILDQLRKGLPIGNYYNLHRSEKQFLDHTLSHHETASSLWSSIISFWPCLGESFFTKGYPYWVGVRVLWAKRKGSKQNCASMLMMDYFVGKIS